MDSENESIPFETQIKTDLLPVPDDKSLEEEIRRSYEKEWDEEIGLNDEVKKAAFIEKRVSETFHAAESAYTAEERGHIDQLTNLPNRVLFERALQKVSNLIEHGANLNVALLTIDADRFKQINDTYGHDKGDDVLRAIAEVLANNFREGDTVARLGGEELGVLLVSAKPSPDHPEIQQSNPVKIAEELKTKISHNIENRTQLKDKTVSIGVANLRVFIDPETGRPHASPAQLKKESDIAVYNAKETGRNKVVQFQKGMTQPQPTKAA